jgi:hypothetical protein
MISLLLMRQIIGNQNEVNHMKKLDSYATWKFVGDRVQFKTDANYNGTVTAVYAIRVCGKRTEVCKVAWDGNPEAIPLTLKDEAGTGRKEGYRHADLLFTK